MYAEHDHQTVMIYVIVLLFRYSGSLFRTVVH